MRALGIGLNVLFWVVAGLFCLLGSIETALLGRVAMMGGPLLLLYGAAFVSWWLLVGPNRSRRILVAATCILGAAPFLYGASPIATLHSRGEGEIEEWLRLIDAGQVERAYGTAQLRMPLDEFRKIVDASGLANHDKRVALGWDEGFKSDWLPRGIMKYQSTDRGGKSHSVGIFVTGQYFFSPTVTGIWMDD